MKTVSLPADQVVEGGLPLYANLTLLTVERHGSLALAPDRSYRFAASHPVVPLMIDEFERAALDYPVIFFGAARRAFAMTSLAPGHNDFIGVGGDYSAGGYIPAYLRRYPFVMVRDPERELSVLALDETAEMLCDADEPGARALFDGEVPSETTREVIAFCEGCEQAQQRTDALVQLLDELDLFEARQAHHRPRLGDGSLGEPVLLLDYAAVNREKFEALGDAELARLRAEDALGPIYAHLMSAANWDRLALVAA